MSIDTPREEHDPLVVAAIRQSLAQAQQQYEDATRAVRRSSSDIAYWEALLARAEAGEPLETPRRRRGFGI